MKIRALVAAFALATTLSGCSLFGVSPEDSEQAREKAEHAVSVAKFFVETASIVINKIDERCQAEPASPLCSKPEIIAAVVLAHDSLSARLVDLQALVDAGSTDAEQMAGAIDLVFAAIDDVTDILAAINASNG